MCQNEILARIGEYIDTLFLQHPRDNHQTYVEHAFASLKFAARFARLAAMAITHAIVPAAFPKSTTIAIRSDLPSLLKSSEDECARTAGDGSQDERPAEEPTTNENYPN